MCAGCKSTHASTASGERSAGLLPKNSSPAACTKHSGRSRACGGGGATHARANPSGRWTTPPLTPRSPTFRITSGRWSNSHAVAAACDKAFPPPVPLAKREDETAAEWKARLTKEQKYELAEWQREHRWHPYQIRHSFATRVRKQHGLEAAQVLLGHARA